MRFISPSSNYTIQVFEGVESVVMDARGFGATQVLKKPVLAQFEHAGLLDHEQKIALESFNFTGLPEGVHPLTRVGVFDSEAYAQRFPEKSLGDQPGRSEMQVQIDKRLCELQAMFPNEFIAVEMPAAEKPWTSYDKDSIEDVLKFQERLEFDPSRIRRYEVENRNRSEIVEAMTALEVEAAAKPETEIVVNA